MQRDTLVSFEGVVKRFGSFVAVQKMDFEIRKGEFLAIMGSSGCGKTTTLRMLAGLEAPSEGVIRLSGKPINDLPTWSRDTPMVWQSLALFPFLNVRENVEFALKMRGVGKAERRRRAEQWLDRMQITEFAERNIAQLSGGQRQRVALARSLVVEPEILLLDEPLSALDAALKVRMQSVLKNLQRETGITFVYVTHSQSEAFSMADRVVIMSRGVIEQIGTPQEIYRTPRTRFVADFLGSSNLFSGKVRHGSAGQTELETTAGTLRIDSDSALPAAGMTATITVLDTKTHLGTTPPARPVNVVPVRVVGEQFVGATATVYLETAQGQEIRVQKGHDELADLSFEIGQDLFAWWDPKDGEAGVDLMVAMIAKDHGQKLADAVAEMCLHSRRREAGTAQKRIFAPMRLRNPAIARVIAAMQANIATPLEQTELAGIFGKTTRHLERTFKAATGDTPKNFYLGLRLEQARDLLAETSMSMLDVAIATGFNSSGTFAKAFRRRFGNSPTSFR